MGVIQTLELDADVLQRIRRLAEERQLAPEDLMLDAIQEYLTNEEWAAKADAAVADFDATGLHLTGEEVDAWLAKLEAGEDAPMPECHT